MASNETLFRRYQQRGDVRALARLFDRTADEVLRVAMHLTRDPAQAEECLQQTFLIAIERAASWDDARPFVPWLLGILRNVVRRAHAARPSLALPQAEMPGPVPRDAIADVEWSAAVAEIVEGLPDPYRAVLVLNLHHGLAPAEIARLHRIPPATVRSQLHRGLGMVREALPAERRSQTLGAAVPLAGMGAVREHVLAAARLAAPTPIAGTSALIGGILMTKKSLSVVIVLALGAWLWRGSVHRAEPDRPSDEPQKAMARHAPRLEGTGLPVPNPDVPGAVEKPADPALAVRVLRHGQPVPDAEVVVGNAMAGKEEATLHTGRTDADGVVRFQTLSGETVGVFAAAPGMGRGYRDVALPRAGVVDIEMPDDRTATIHVRRGDTLDPVAGAEVMLAGPGTLPLPRGTGCLPPLPEIRTDANGDAVVSGLPREYVWVGARAPGLAMASNGRPFQGVILRAPDTRATVTLWPRRVVRFPIKATGAGAPEDGTQLELTRYQPSDDAGQGEPTARIEDRHLVLEPFPPGLDWGHVISADGTLALWRVRTDRDMGEPVEFRKIHDIRVRLRWKDGTPAADQVLFAILQPRGKKPRVRTDAQGLAVFPTCVAESAQVMWSATEQGSALPVAKVNLVSAPGEMVVAIDRPIDYAVRIRVNGAPRLPDDYEVHVKEMAPDRPPDELRRIWDGLDDDPENGEIRFRWLPLPGGAASPVTIRAPGLPASAATPVKGADGIWRATVDLASTTTLRVRVAAPAHTPYFLYLERWREQYERYHVPDERAARQTRRNARDDVHTFRGFAPGRYRLREYYSGITSKPFELTSGGADLDLELDLSTSVIVRGRILVPRGESPAYATLRLASRDGGSVSRSNPVRVQGDGSYEFRAPEGERHRILVEHPLLVARDAPPEIVVGSDVPVIHLVEGPQLVFRIEGSDLTTEPTGRGSPAWRSPVRVSMAHPGEWESDGYDRMTVAHGGRFRVGVPEPGTWDVRIERFGFVPHIVRGVKVEGEPVDLGTIALSKGASLTVRLLRGAQPFPSQPCVIATRLGPMPYEATGYKVEAGEPPHIVLHGLGRGTFKVVVSQLYIRDGDLAEHEVVCDGETDFTLDVRLP